MDSKTSPYKRQFNVKVLFRFVPATPSRSASSMSRSCFALSLSLSQVIVGCQGRDPRLGKALPETFRVIRILSIRDAMAIGGSIARSRSRLQLHTKLTLQSKPPQSVDHAIGLEFGMDHMQHIPWPQNQSLEAIYLSLPTGSTVKLPKPIFEAARQSVQQPSNPKPSSILFMVKFEVLF